MVSPGGFGVPLPFPDKYNLKHLGFNDFILVLSLNLGRDGRAGCQR